MDYDNDPEPPCPNCVELARQNKILRGVLEDLSCDGCEYGDNCPPGANHYVCSACHMTRALKDAR